jgi:hypothetical protein
MGVLEMVVVFQAVAEEAVSADVGEPDQAEGKDKVLALPPAEPNHGGRQRRAVGWPVAEYAMSEPASRTAPSRRSQRRGTFGGAHSGGTVRHRSDRPDQAMPCLIRPEAAAVAAPTEDRPSEKQTLP